MSLNDYTIENPNIFKDNSLNIKVIVEIFLRSLGKILPR